MKRLTTEEFIERARKVHGDKYDYSKVEYVNATTKVCIICPTHGEFWQIPYTHLKGYGCSTCAGVEKWSYERLVREGKKKYNDRFDYLQSNIKKGNDLVAIKCNVCGTIFYQSPKNHINSIQGGCPTCKYKYIAQNEKISFEDFKTKATLIHKGKYIYNKDTFTDMHSKVGVVCKKHGLFFTYPHNHLKGSNCPACTNERISQNQTLSKDDFLERSINKHGNKYDYSNVNYVSSGTKVEIVCPIHGSFLQTPHNHWKGEGCPLCAIDNRAFTARISLGEKKIAWFFDQNNIIYKKQYRIKDSNIKVRSYLLADYFLPEYNAIVEYNGEQHYKPISFFGGEKVFKRQQERDMALRQYCKEHKIKLIEIPYWELDNIDTMLTSFFINKVK